MNPTQVSGSVFLIPRAKGGVWYARLRIDGEQKKVKLGMLHAGRDRPLPGFLSERMAQAALEDLKAEARRGGVKVQRNTGAKLSEVFDGYIADLAEKGREQTYLRGLRMGVRSTILSGFGDPAIERITEAKCQAWVRKLRKQGLADSTIRRYMRAMDCAMKYAVRHYGLRDNPMAGVEKPAAKSSNAFNTLDATQLLRLSAEASTYMYAAVYSVAGFCGLRLGELRALQWRDVRWAEKAIMVRRNCPTTTNQLTTPKSGRERSVPMAEPVRAELAAWQLRSKGGPDDLVFPEDGTWFSEYHLRTAFHKTLADCGFKRMRLHDLRHSAATIFATANPNMYAVQHWMGHSSITITEKYYHHRSHSTDADMLSRFIAAA
jgi:integrase